MNDRFLREIEKTKEYVMIVEGKKDKAALHQLGFEKVFMINETGKSLYEKIEEFINTYDKKEKVCILTDFDKKGKKLYLLLKSKLAEQGVRLDGTLRGLLLKERISHIEGLASYMKNQNQNQHYGNRHR